MKKAVLLALALLLFAGMAVGCASSGNEDNAGQNPNQTENEAGSDNGNENSPADNGGEPVTLKIFQFKVEIAEAFGRLIKEYEKETGVKIELETVGGGASYEDALKAKFAQGDFPDIFNNSGYSDRDLYLEHLEDLSDQPWVEHLYENTKEPMTKDGKLYGMPIGIEGYGYIYNKDLFEQAGIEELPQTISELEAVARQLQDAGITPFSNGYGEWWVLGNHLASVPFAQQPDPQAFLQGLQDGSETFADNEIFQEWVNLLDLTLEYGNDNPLTTDYNTQVTLFATGETAMMQQGNWTQVQIDEINPDLNIGFLPMAFNDDAEKMDRLPVGVPNNWVVYKNSPVKEEAKAFLNWLVTSETGQRYITEEFKFIPALDNIQADPEVLGDLASDIMKYSQEQKTISWVFTQFPNSTSTARELSAEMQAYIAGQQSKDDMLTNFQQYFTGE